jgi:anti-sigma-K factor RskA
MRVTLTKGKTAPVPQGRATYVASKGSLIFLANNLEPLKPGKTYELWLIPAEAGGSPIPAGTFRPDERGNASVIMPPLPKGVEAKAFGVTVEDEGGAATPTQPIILAGE